MTETVHRHTLEKKNDNYDEGVINRTGEGLIRILNFRGLELTMADAAFLREKVREVYLENKLVRESRGGETLDLYGESYARWLVQMYQLNREHLKMFVEEDDKQKGIPQDVELNEYLKRVRREREQM